MTLDQLTALKANHDAAVISEQSDFDTLYADNVAKTNQIATLTAQVATLQATINAVIAAVCPS